jgi:toxoflavin biosynthesis protein ToxD
MSAGRSSPARAAPPEAAAPGAPSGLDLVTIDAATARVGSSLEEVRRCTLFWSDRLVDPAYRPRFKGWIMKEWPAHRRRLPAYRIGRFPVTNADYGRFVAAEAVPAPPSLAQGEPPDHPVWGVTIEEAHAFARWAGGRLGQALRLPAEHEWEYAARGAADLEYPFGNAFDSRRCNTVEAGIGTTTPVDRYARFASPWGVCDLAGNVEEWTASHYRPYPGGAFVADDLVSGESRSYPVLRGGCFALGGDLARCARRHGPHDGARFRYRGFRLAASAAA